jgi:fused signal recognition particle receptor
MGFFEKIAGGLKKTRESVMGSLGSMLSAFTRIDRELFDELEEILIMSDVGTVTAAKLREQLEQRVKAEGVTDPAAVRSLLQDTVADLLSGDQSLHLTTHPSVILVIGVNGVGKTTTIGKLAHNLQSQGKKVLLAAADTFRDAAIEQLDIWAKRANVDIVRHTQGADPGAVVFDAIQAAKARGADVVICDTAGRLHNKKHLMDELNKISRIIDRELADADKEVLLVLDATTGQNAVNQAREFKQAAGITGIVLTKLDGTARGGVVLAIKGDLDVPVKYIGVGEGIDDLQPFDPDAFAAGMFGE